MVNNKKKLKIDSQFIQNHAALSIWEYLTFRPSIPTKPTGPSRPVSPYKHTQANMRHKQSDAALTLLVCLLGWQRSLFPSRTKFWLLLTPRNVYQNEWVCFLTLSPFGAFPGESPGSPFFPWEKEWQRNKRLSVITHRTRV